MSEQRVPNVGAQVRVLRQQRGLSLRTLAELCDLSPNTISLIERGDSSPSVSTLHRLATALRVPITAFFEENPEPVQVVFTRAADRARSGSASVRLESLGSGLEAQSIEPFLVTMRPGADSGQQLIVHAGQEMVFCIEGQAEYEVAGQRHHLAAGDTLLFDAQLPHRWRNPTEQPTTFLMVFCSSGKTSPVEQHLRS